MPLKLNRTYLYIGIGILFLLVLAIALTIWRSNSNKIVLLNNPDKEKVFLPKLLTDNQSIYYYSQDKNEIKKWNLKNNSTETWIKLPFKDTDNIIYAPDLTQALVQTINPSNAAEHHTYLINLTTKQVVKQLSDNLLAVDWSPDGKKIAYHYLDWNSEIDTDQIATSAPDGTQVETLAKIDFENIKIVWANDTSLIYYNVPFEAFLTKISLISITTKKEEVIGDQYYLGDIIRISPNKLLIDATTSDSAQTNLNLLDTTKKTLIDLKSSSSVSKSTYAGKNSYIYAAYNKLESTVSSDLFQVINLETKKITNLKIKSKDKIDANNLMLSSDVKTLYFISNNNLYKKNL